MVIRSLSLLLLGAPLLWAGESWLEKPFTQWTTEDLFEITQDSPWAKTLFLESGPARVSVVPDTSSPPVIVPIYNRRGGVIGYKVLDRSTVKVTLVTEVVVVQWASSVVLRQARVRQGQLKGILAPEQAAELLATQPKQYVISVRGSPVPSMSRELNQLDQSSPGQSVYLKPKRSKLKIHPIGVEVRTMGEPEAFLAGEPVVWFYFPRELAGQPVIGRHEEKVEFHWNSARKRINITFNLGRMTRDGKPDL